MNFIINSYYIKRPFIPLFLFFSCGILAGEKYNFPPAIILILIFLNLVWLIILYLIKKRDFISPFLLFFLIGIHFILPFNIENFFNKGEDIDLYLNEKSIVTGVVSGLYTKTFKRAKTDFILMSYKGEDISHKNIKIKLTIYNTKNLKLPGYGEIISIKTKVKKFSNFKNTYSFDYKSYMRHSGFHGMAWALASNVEVVGKKNSFSIIILNLREKFSQIIDVNFKDKNVSAFLKTITTGHKKVLGENTRDEIIKSGSAHFMAISGLHIGMIFTFTYLVSRYFFSYFNFFILRGLLDKASLLSGLIFAVFYFTMSGMMPSAQRALVIVFLSFFAIFLNKKTDPLNLLFACAFFILFINPRFLFSLGFIFSFIAVFFIILGFNIFPEKIVYREKISLKTKLKILIKTNFFAVIGTYPLGLYFFYILPFYGAFTGIILVPVFSIIILPFAFFGIAFFYILKPLSKACFFISGIGVDFFLDFTNLVSNLLFSNFYFGISTYELFLIYSSIFFLFWLCYGFKSNSSFQRGGLISALFLSTLIIADISYVVKNRFYNDYGEVFMFDIGKGNCALIRFPHGKTLLIDAGGFARSDFDTGKLVIAPDLLKKRIKTIDYAIVTHGHTDHYKGFFHLLNNFKIKNFIFNYSITSNPEFLRLKSLTLKKGILIEPGLISLERGEIDFFQLKDRFLNENDNSLIIKVKIDGISILFTGDLLKASQKIYKEYKFIEDSDIFMIPHHGSKNSLEKGFIKKADPDLAIISGNFRGYKKTHEFIRRFYNDIDIDVYNINKQGCFWIKIRDNKFRMVNNN